MIFDMHKQAGLNGCYTVFVSPFEAAASFNQAEEERERKARGTSGTEVYAFLLRAGVNTYLPRVGWLGCLQPRLQLQGCCCCCCQCRNTCVPCAARCNRARVLRSRCLGMARGGKVPPHVSLFPKAVTFRRLLSARRRCAHACATV